MKKRTARLPLAAEKAKGGGGGGDYHSAPSPKKLTTPFSAERGNNVFLPPKLTKRARVY